MIRSAPIGHNGVAGEQIRSIFKRWEHLEDEKRSAQEDLKELFAEARGYGLNGKALRAAFRRKLQLEDANQRDKIAADDADFDLYLAALVGTDGALTRGSREEAGT